MNLLENLTMLLRTWRQFAFYFNKSLEKGSVKSILTFKEKLLSVEPGSYGRIRGNAMVYTERKTDLKSNISSYSAT